MGFAFISDLRIDNPNEMWFKWEALFLEVCGLHDQIYSPLNTFVPLKVHALPLSLRLRYRRDRLKIKPLRIGDPSDWSNFKKLRYEVNNAIKKVYAKVLLL